MMKHWELIVALLLSSSILFTRAYEEVCFPDRFEGQRFDMVTRTTSFFAIDYVERRALVTNSPASDTFDVFDFGNNCLLQHRFRGGNCNDVQHESNDFFDRCIHDDFHLPNLLLGELDHSLDVRVIGYRIPVSNTSRVIMTTEHDGVTLPFFQQDLHDDGSFRTTFFFRMSNSLSCFNNNLYSDVSECVHLAVAENI